MSDLVSNKSPSGVWVWVWVWVMPIGLILTVDSTLSPRSGSRYSPSAVQGEGVNPKKSLQWTRGLVIRGETMHLLLLNR